MGIVDTFQLGRLLHEKFPDIAEFDAPAVDTAMEELAHSSQEIERIVTELNRLRIGDYESFAQLLTDLQGRLEHVVGHIEEAMPELIRLLEAVSEKSELVAPKR